MTLLTFLSFIISFIFGLIAIPNIVIISKRKRLFDTYNTRKVHSTPIPRLGGLAFMPSIAFATCIVMALRSVLRFKIPHAYINPLSIELPFLIAGAFLIFLIGLADDLIGVDYKKKFILQFVCALFIICSGLYLDSLYGLFGLHTIPAPIGIFLTVLIILAIINSFNLIDGVDGLCSGLSIIALSALTLWFWYNELFTYAFIGASTVGIVTAFFIFNVSPLRKKIFMGDGGSLILGYFIAFLGMKFITLNVCSSNFDTFSAPVLLLSMIFVPTFDCIRVFFDRIKSKKSPFYPDKTHIHHYFLKMGYSHLQSTGLILAIALTVIIINFALSEININFLLLIDILFGYIFLNFIPKRIIKKQNKHITDN